MILVVTDIGNVRKSKTSWFAFPIETVCNRDFLKFKTKWKQVFSLWKVSIKNNDIAAWDMKSLTIKLLSLAVLSNITEKNKFIIMW